MLDRSANLAMSTSVLKALSGKLDIKRHSPSNFYIHYSKHQTLVLPHRYRISHWMGLIQSAVDRKHVQIRSLTPQLGLDLVKSPTTATTTPLTTQLIH